MVDWSIGGALWPRDALHTQSDTAQVIRARGADCVMTVKGRMPVLHRKLKKLPWPAVPATSAVTKDHGRRARRTVKVTLSVRWAFAGALGSLSLAVKAPG